LADDDQLRSVTARLVIECPNFDINLHHHIIELYVAWDLHDLTHHFEVKAIDRRVIQPKLHLLRTTVSIPDGGVWHSVPPYLVVARPGCGFFDDHFHPSVFKIDFALISNFIFKHGKSDPERSTISTTIEDPSSSSTTGATGRSNHILGSRVDFGNAGQASEPGFDIFRPKTMCGTHAFPDNDEGEAIRLMIGKIIDAMCNCTKNLSQDVGRPSVMMSARRFDEFSSELRKFLFAKHCVTEWVTLQLLNLSHDQGGEPHKDVLNDPREGYNVTMCFCLHFTDGVGDLWSLKIITGYRKKVGDWLSLQLDD
jgi:hypothetical protein